MSAGPESFSPEPQNTKADVPGAEEGELETQRAELEAVSSEPLDELNGYSEADFEKWRTENGMDEEEDQIESFLADMEQRKGQ